ncbi:hypothetical protein [Vibrio parahaemolyticus]|uniref:hypothetical protein n=1 Tax=Vibrio parahaemolyticus TaxID=670 RepID=UPI0011211452|nr:hypothetical protein [Vibrio parahaemolyticus]TOP26716.1 hypothetical protein CGH19_23640 [Vibrio parahaemolyticus]
MGLEKSLSLSESFKALYCEFIDYLNRTGLSNRVLVVIDGKPTIDFQFTIQSMGGIDRALEILTALPSYSKVVELTAKLQGVPEDEVRKTRYGLFAYLFSDIANCVNPPQVSYAFSKSQDLSSWYLDEDRLSKAILEATTSGSCIERTNKYLIVFENVQIESDIKINEELTLIRLSRAEVKSKFTNRYDSDKKWERVYSAFEVSDTYLSNDGFIPVLSTLLRLYQKGDVRFKLIAQQAHHLIRGDIYINHKNGHSELDYYEHLPSVRNDAWRQYRINEAESSEFAKFVSENLLPMMTMSHSCQMYNMVSSSPLHLRIPLLFFVIESFFSDVSSEVVFRVALYVTVLLEEDAVFKKRINDLYHVRSCIAHGDLAAAKKRIQKMKLSGFSGATELVEEILQKLWLELLVRAWEPNKSNELINAILLKSNKNT